MTTFHCDEEGLAVYVDGKRVALIEPRYFPALLVQLAQAMRSAIKPLS
ncbi:MAG: hypothetical protein RI906_3343 [Pseudomonadota bacterium]|jgi:hypothetical protein